MLGRHLHRGETTEGGLQRPGGKRWQPLRAAPSFSRHLLRQLPLRFLRTTSPHRPPPGPKEENARPPHQIHGVPSVGFHQSLLHEALPASFAILRKTCKEAAAAGLRGPHARDKRPPPARREPEPQAGRNQSACVGAVWPGSICSRESSTGGGGSLQSPCKGGSRLLTGDKREAGCPPKRSALQCAETPTPYSPLGNPSLNPRILPLASSDLSRTAARRDRELRRGRRGLLPLLLPWARQLWPRPPRREGGQGSSPTSDELPDLALPGAFLHRLHNGVGDSGQVAHVATPHPTFCPERDQSEEPRLKN